MCPVRVLTSTPVDTSQRRTVLSSEAVARKRASEENATSEIPCSWPMNSWRGDPSEVDQVRAVLSAEQVAMSLPSSENLTLEMARLWPVRVCLSL